MTAITFQVDVSRTFKNKEGYEAGGYRLNTSFKTETHTPESFLDSVVREGWPYTMVHAKRSPQETGAAARNVKTPKHTENFISRQDLTGDIDNKQARPGVIDGWLHDSFFARYGWGFVESVNSIPGKVEKGHPTLIFDRPITCPKLWKECMQAWIWKCPDLDPAVAHADLTVYNAQNARVHLLGNICPFDVFEAEVLTPYREHLARQARIEAEYQQRRAAELEQARAEGRIRTDAGAFENYLQAGLDGIFRFVASQAHQRHGGIYWAGQKVGALKAADWTRPYMPADHELESRIIEAARINGYLATYAHDNESEVLRTFNDGRRLGSANKAPEPELYERKTPEAKAAALTPEALAELEQIGAEARAGLEGHDQRSQELGELGSRLQAHLDDLRIERTGGYIPHFQPDVIPFDVCDSDDYRREILPARKAARGARAWRDHVTVYFPELDPAEEYRRKRADDKKKGMRDCRRPIHYRSIDGKWRAKFLLCGLCPDCQKQIKDNLKKAIAEVIQDSPGQCLTLLTANSAKERARIVRKAKRLLEDNGLDPKLYKSIPTDEGTEYHVLLAGFYPDEGEILDIVDITDELLARWMNTPEGQRTRGQLFPNFRALLNQHKPDDELEIPRSAVYVELEKFGAIKRVSLAQAEYYKNNLGYREIARRVDRSKVSHLADLPEDPVAIGFELLGIVTNDKLPPEAAAVEEEVTTADQLQKAHSDIHLLTIEDLRKRKGGNVILCIVEFRKFYAQTDIPELCRRFNETNRERLDKMKAKQPA